MSRQSLLLQLATDESPHYVIDEGLLIQNLEKLKYIKDQTGCKILLALKAFASYHVFDLIAKYLDGVAASSLNEVRLGQEFFKKEIHTYSPAFEAKSLGAICQHSGHIIFNSLNQLATLGDIAIKQGCAVGIRLNLETSVAHHALYDPSVQYSRFGVTRSEYDKCVNKPSFSGIHIHNACGVSKLSLEKTFKCLEEKFDDLLQQVDWVNIGGSHYVTDDNYDAEYLISMILYLKDKYNVQIYMEPGYAVAADAGFLCGKVLDIVNNEKETAILNVSPTAHMPDVLEIGYHPPIIGATHPHEGAYNYILGSNTCLSCDIVGEYAFSAPLQINSPIVLGNMLVYTTVKSTMFNGIQHPGLMLLDKKGVFHKLKAFEYSDYVSRL